MLATDELERLNTALVFIDLILLDIDEVDDLTIDELIRAARSYVRSVTMLGLRPSDEAQRLYGAMHSTIGAYSGDCTVAGAGSLRG